MNPEAKYQELLNRYEFGNKNGNGYRIYEENDDWFTLNSNNGNLSRLLKGTLLEVLHSKDLKKFDFVLLTMQALAVKYDDAVSHYKMAFQIAENILQDFTESEDGDRESWLLHQLVDICYHDHIEVEKLSKKNPSLISSVVEKIGQVSYQTQVLGPEMYFAAYKAMHLLGYMSKSEAKRILVSIYLKHSDSRVADDALDLQKYFKG